MYAQGELWGPPQGAGDNSHPSGTSVVLDAACAEDDGAEVASISDISNSLTLHSSLHQQLVDINTRPNEVDQCCFWQVYDKMKMLLIINKTFHICTPRQGEQLDEGAELRGGSKQLLSSRHGTETLAAAARLNTTTNRIQLFRENSVMWTVIWMWYHPWILSP